MQAEESTTGKAQPDKPSWDSIVRAEEELLNRAREVAQQITDRVRRLLENDSPESPEMNQPPQTA